ncbi:MAG: hypothetical protein LBN01_04565 [Endomicrobium sp.]|jgi:hypothetical protein|nr:hypothetical protein [Endomicrobium sp.]
MKKIISMLLILMLVSGCDKVNILKTIASAKNETAVNKPTTHPLPAPAISPAKNEMADNNKTTVVKEIVIEKEKIPLVVRFALNHPYISAALVIAVIFAGDNLVHRWLKPKKNNDPMQKQVDTLTGQLQQAVQDLNAAKILNNQKESEVATLTTNLNRTQEYYNKSRENLSRANETIKRAEQTVKNFESNMTRLVKTISGENNTMVGIEINNSVTELRVFFNTHFAANDS